MRTRDIVRWNFAPWDLLLVAGIALVGFGMGVLDVAVDALEGAVDRLSEKGERR